MRDDYVYKAAVINKIVLGRRSLNTVSVVDEFRLHESRADLLLIDSELHAVEIKSDRDSLARVEAQVASYRLVCPKVSVVTNPGMEDQLLRRLPESTGIYVLTDRMTLRALRLPNIDRSEIDVKALLDCIRIQEIRGAARLLGVEIPKVPNTKARTSLDLKLTALPASVLAPVVTSVLRQSRSQGHIQRVVFELPMPLRPAAIMARLTQPQILRLLSHMEDEIRI